MPNQPLINALMGGQLGQQQPFGSNIFGTNNQQWGSGGAEQTPQQPNPTGSPWSGMGDDSNEWRGLQGQGGGFLQWLMPLLMNRGQNPSAFFGSQPRMQPPTGMPGAWGQGSPWGQQGGQG